MAIPGSEFFSQSTFQTAQKDLFGIVTKIINNEELKKLLFYPTRDALSKPKLTEEETFSLLDNSIRVVPKLYKEDSVNTYVMINFDNFVTNQTNPEYRDNTVSFEIICHMDNWSMENYQLRPYLIMGQLDKMLNNKKLNGIGTVQFLSANLVVLSNEFAGYSLSYRVVNDL